MIKPLPKWVLTNNYPAFYDTESVTAIEMVAKIYGKMEELITSYNEFVDEINKTMEDFDAGIISDIDEFKDYVNGRLATQDEVIADAVNYMKDNIQETASILFNEFLQTGQIYVSLATDYDDTTESLILGIDALPSEELLEDLSALATVEDGE